MRRILTLVLAAVLLSGCVGKKTEAGPTVVEEGTQFSFGSPCWTRFAAAKPRRWQQSTGLLPRAAF